MSDLKVEEVLKQFLLSITGNDIMQTNNNNYDCIDKFIKSDRYKNLLEQANGAEKSDTPALNLPVVNNSALILKVRKLEAENKLLQFMVDNGINEEEMFNSNDITMPQEI